MPKIAVYAGHGGSDPGAVGNGFFEKDLNLAVSNAVSGILRQRGYLVINNRYIDVNRDIATDIIYANENMVDALVEIHQNSNEGPPESGSEVIYSARGTGKGEELANAILKRLTALGFANRGIRSMVNEFGQDSLAIIRQTKMPAVVVESAFINNPNDMALFDVNNVAGAIAEGIIEVFPINYANGPIYPGQPLRIGSTGENVRRVQRCLNNISETHPQIPRIAVDGIFGANTLFAVVTFQQLFGLSTDGVVGPITWDRIMAECGPITDGGNGGNGNGGYRMELGSRGENVTTVQRCLNNISRRFPSIPEVPEDGIFGSLMLSAVVEFQRIFGLNVDGIVGGATWNRIMSECNVNGTIPPFPGETLRLGSFGEPVAHIQQCLNNISTRIPSIQRVNVDSIFGVSTMNAVIAFQRQFGMDPDGIVEPLTWDRIMRECPGAVTIQK